MLSKVWMRNAEVFGAVVDYLLNLVRRHCVLWSDSADWNLRDKTQEHAKPSELRLKNEVNHLFCLFKKFFLRPFESFISFSLLLLVYFKVHNFSLWWATSWRRSVISKFLCRHIVYFSILEFQTFDFWGWKSPPNVSLFFFERSQKLAELERANAIDIKKFYKQSGQIKSF